MMIPAGRQVCYLRRPCQHLALGTENQSWFVSAARARQPSWHQIMRGSGGAGDLPQHLHQTCHAAPYQARFAELAAELGCALHDPLPGLLRIPADERRRLRWEKDIHFTPAGHEALARSLEPVLAGMLAQGPSPLPAAGPREVA